MIPPKLRPQVLEELYQGHMRVVKMKALARSYIWWPGIDKEIELTVRSCSGCQLTQRAPSTVPAHPWKCTSIHRASKSSVLFVKSDKILKED